jgi:hypothetical protein
MDTYTNITLYEYKNMEDMKPCFRKYNSVCLQVKKGRIFITQMIFKLGIG